MGCWCWMINSNHSKINCYSASILILLIYIPFLSQMAEYRISIYGRKQSEWDQLASWIVNNDLYSENVVWLIQVTAASSLFFSFGLWIFCFFKKSCCRKISLSSAAHFELFLVYYFLLNAIHSFNFLENQQFSFFFLQDL